MSEPTLPLCDAIRALRAEIQAAAAAGEGETLRFELGAIDLEFQVVAKRETTGNGKISFHIFGIGAEVGGGVKGADERTQKVKFVLNPVDIVDGKPQKKLVRRKPAQVEGDPQP
jgi:hypothetical protein